MASAAQHGLPKGLDFPERLHILRRRRGLPIRALAAMVHVGASTISSWERGETEPTVTNLVALAGVFGLTLDELVGYDSSAASGERVNPGKRIRKTLSPHLRLVI